MRARINDKYCIIIEAIAREKQSTHNIHEPHEQEPKGDPVEISDVFLYNSHSQRYEKLMQG
jgi:hypothetical protein